MLDLVIHLLIDLDTLQEHKHEVGAVLLQSGMSSKHLDLVGEALIYALRDTLDDDSFTEKTEASWRLLYNYLITAL